MGRLRAILVIGATTAIALAPGRAPAAPQVAIKAHTDLHLGPVRKDYDGNYVVSGQLVDKLTGQGIGGFHLHVRLGSRTVDAVTSRDGSFQAAVAGPGGKQDVAVDFAGGASLDAAHVALHDVDVDKEPLDLHLVIAPLGGTADAAVPPGSMTRGGGAQVTVTATTPGPDGEVKVNVPVAIAAGAADAVDLKPAGTATAGGPPFRLTRAAAGGAGRRKVRVTFAGDNVYAPATAEATVELTTATSTTFALDDAKVAFEDDVTGGGRVVDEDGRGVPRATIAVLAGDRHMAEAQTDADGRYRITFEAQTLGAGPHGLQVVVETATGWMKPSRSPPVTLTIAAPEPVPVAWTMIAFVATAGAAFGFFAARTRPWARWLSRPAAAAPASAPRAEPTSGLVLSRPGLVSTLRRPHDHTFTGAVRDAVRGRPIAFALIELVLGGDRRTAHTGGDGGFAFDDLPAGDWQVSCAAPGHVTERFVATLPHRGELRDARIDLVPVRERVFTLYRRAALPLLPSPGLWGIWSPRQIIDHVRGHRRATPSTALAQLTDFVEEAYFSARTPEEAILPDAETRVEAAVREQSLV
jgi:Carboxypeptidase regulatory-like domain